jgi:vesicle-associated membrane protein 7
MSKIVPKLLNSKETHQSTIVITQDKAEINYKFDSSSKFFYFVICSADTPKRVVWNFLSDIEENYKKLPNPSAYSAKNLLESKIKFFNDPKNDKITNLKNKVEDVKSDMITNIEKILDRGEKLDKILVESEALDEEAFKYNKKSKQLKNTTIIIFISLIGIIALIVLCLLLVVIVVIIVVILIIVFSVCGIDFKNCKK